MRQDAAWRWNQEGGELKLKQVRRTLGAPRFEETFPGLWSLQVNGRCDPEGQEPGDACIRGLEVGARGCGVPRPCSGKRRRGAWRSLGGDEGVGGGPEACGAVQCCAHASGTWRGLTLEVEAGVLGRWAAVEWCEVAGFRLGPLSGGGERESYSPLFLPIPLHSLSHPIPSP